MGTTARRSSRPYVAQRRVIAPVRPRNVRYPEPAPDRLKRPRKRRQPALPLVVKVLLAVALLAMGAATTVAAGGLVGGALSRLGGTVAAIFDAQLNGPTPSPAPLSAPGAPRLVLTGTGWTNQSDLTVHGFVPQGLGDQRGYSVRVYVNGELAGEQDLTGTQDFAVTVPIPDGPSLITATILGPTGEGAESAPIQVVFDDTPPSIKISAPKNGATIKAESVIVKGTTQADSTVTVRNDSNGGRASAVASKGAFAIEISITGGPNALEVTAVDPAGNSKTTTLNVIGGNGSASASVSLTKTSFKLSALPSAIGATVRVLGPNGKAISGAAVVFTIQIPGIGPVQSPEILTVAGSASFKTQVPTGATAGAGLVTVIVTTDSYGTLSGTAAFRIS